MRTQRKKCLTHKRKLNNLLEYLNRQKNGKSHQSSSVMESGCEDKDGSFTARLKHITNRLRFLKPQHMETRRQLFSLTTFVEFVL